MASSRSVCVPTEISTVLMGQGLTVSKRTTNPRRADSTEKELCGPRDFRLAVDITRPCAYNEAPVTSILCKAVNLVSISKGR